MGGCAAHIFTQKSKIYLTFSKFCCTFILEVAKLGKNIAIKTARAELDITQKELAELVGVSRQTINAIEKGEYNPTIKLCRAICRVLGKSLDELFWEEESNEN